MSAAEARGPIGQAYRREILKAIRVVETTEDAADLLGVSAHVLEDLAAALDVRLVE